MLSFAPMTTSEREKPVPREAREAVLRDVAEVLIAIEQAVDGAAKARESAAQVAGCDDLARVLNTAARSLQATRTDLFQGAYFAGNQPRLV
jgi:ribosomal protein L17